MPPRTKSKKRKRSARRKTKRRKGVQIGSPQVFELYGGQGGL